MRRSKAFGECGLRARRVAVPLLGAAAASLGAAAAAAAQPAGAAAGTHASRWEYALVVALVFGTPLAMLVCGLVAMRRVSRPLLIVALALLVGGAAIMLRQVLITGPSELMPRFAIPLLATAALLYPLAAIALVRAVAGGDRRLASPVAASRLLIVASVVQLFAPWMLTSGA